MMNLHWAAQATLRTVQAQQENSGNAVTMTITTATSTVVPTVKTMSAMVLLALATVYVVWGSTYLAIRYALVSFPPLLQMGTRFLMAGALLYAFMRWRGAPHPTRLQWRDATLMGTLLLVIGMGSVALASQHITSGMIALLVACSPLIAALWSRLFGSWPTLREWVGIGIGVVGVGVLASGTTLAASPASFIILLVGLSAWTLGSVLSQHTLKLAPGPMGYASEMLAAGVILIVLGLLRGESIAWPPQPVAAFAWAYLVIAGSLCAFSAYLYLLANVSPTVAMSYVYVNPVIAVALGGVLAGEVLSAREWIGSVVLLSAVVVMLWRKNKT
jgi:drug/metabolite transporter (DMT)-like permease